MTSQTLPTETKNRSTPDPTGPYPTVPEDGRGRYRALMGGVILALVAFAALAAGGWGAISSLTGDLPPARMGENVEVPGGLLRIEKVTPEHMAPMQSSKFSAGGMSMSSTGMDMAPEGYERFAVEVTLAGHGRELAYAPEDFRLSGPGVKDHGPVRSQLGAGSLADGSAVAGSLIFQTPEDSKGLKLEFNGGRPIALNLPASKGEAHGH